MPNAKFLSNFLWNELQEKLTTFIILPLAHFSVKTMRMQHDTDYLSARFNATHVFSAASKSKSTRSTPSQIVHYFPSKQLQFLESKVLELYFVVQYYSKGAVGQK